jgi:hypothetical protein
MESDKRERIHDDAETHVEKKVKTDDAGGQTATENGSARTPKRKVAVLLSYRGTGYSGMQVYATLPLNNPNAAAITML